MQLVNHLCIHLFIHQFIYSLLSFFNHYTFALEYIQYLINFYLYIFI